MLAVDLLSLALIMLCYQVMLVVKNPPASAGGVRDVGSIPGLERSPGGGHSNPLQYFSSIVAWRIPKTGKPGGSHFIGHD